MAGKHPLQHTSVLISLIAWGLIGFAELHAAVQSQPAPAASQTTPTKSKSESGRNTGSAPVEAADTTTHLNGHKYDLAKSKDLQGFLQDVKALREKAEEQKEEKKEKEKKTDRKRDWSSKKVRHALKALEHIASDLQKGKGQAGTSIQQIQEIAWAVESNFMQPYFWRSSVELGDTLFHARDLMLNASGRGNSKHPAANLLIYDAADLGRVNPAPSTFWSPPGSIASKNLYAGFNRDAIPNYNDSICEYDSAHKGYGIHPSFEVIWHDQHWKVKFDEEHSSGPFGSRIFQALGYPTEMQDYTPEVKVRWDRRILSKFNARQLNRTEVTLLRIPLTVIKHNRYFDPFNYIKEAVLKDGTHLDVQQFRERLFSAGPGRRIPKHPEEKTHLYDANFEKSLDYLVMKDASFTPKDFGDAEDIGAWDYNALGHPKLRELRGLGVLDAWLDNWDVRWGNNRLFLTETKDGSYRLQHCVSDVGALFGNSTGLARMVHGHLALSLYQNAPNDYGWVFTHKQDLKKQTVPIKDYMPVSRSMPFYEMNRDDADWMARLIGQLTEEQIKAALIGSGYEAAEARLLLEKLVARRDAMVQDFGLTGEIPLLRPHGVNRKFSYDPETDGPFEAVLPSGKKVRARSSGEYAIVHGTLKRTEGRGDAEHIAHKAETDIPTKAVSRFGD